MEPWRTAIASTSDGEIRLRGYEVTALMQRTTFTDTIFLLHRGCLPSPEQRQLLDAILTGVADHGSGSPSCATARLAASGNRQSLSAAVAAGILAVGDEHGGAGSNCMEMIERRLARARSEGSSVAAAADRTFSEARAGGHARARAWSPRAYGRPSQPGALRDGTHQWPGWRRHHLHGGASGSGARPGSKCCRSTSTARWRPCSTTWASTRPSVASIFIIGRVAGLTAEVAEELEREKPMRIKVPVEVPTACRRETWSER